MTGRASKPRREAAVKVTSRHPRHPRLVPGAAVGDLDRFGDTAHPTQSGLERDNTPADRKSRRAAPPCPAWPASRGVRSHRADFSWTAHFKDGMVTRRYLSAQYLLHRLRHEPRIPTLATLRRVGSLRLRVCLCRSIRARWGSVLSIRFHLLGCIRWRFRGGTPSIGDPVPILGSGLLGPPAW